MTIAIVVPTLGRPGALRPLLASITTATPAGVANIIFVVDHNDKETHVELQSAWKQGWNFKVLFEDGTYPQKVNAGMRACSDPLVLPTADDVVFYPRWLEYALAAFGPGVNVVGTNDLTPITADGTHATMPIIRRSYIEQPGAAFAEPGVLFHEGYHHNRCETETCQLAMRRGVWQFCAESIIEHRHHTWGSREVDETDRRGNLQNREADEALFAEREAAWLGSA